MNWVAEVFEGISTKKFQKIPRNELLVSFGVADRNLYFVKNGSLAIFTKIADSEQIIRLAYPGSVIFLPDSFITNFPTKYEIRALKNCEIISVSREEFLKCFEGKEALLQNIYEQLILDFCERELDLLTPSAKDRYENLLRRSPQVFQQIPHKYIASYLRISPETLSRLQKS